MIRPATDLDADAVADIYLDCRRCHVPFARLVHPEDEVRSWIRNDLIAGGGVRVLDRCGSVVAMVATSLANEGSWIDHFYVRADLTGQGLGRLLLEETLKELDRPVWLYTFEENLGARRFYERHGFRIVSFSDGTDNEENCPDVLYRLD